MVFLRLKRPASSEGHDRLIAGQRTLAGIGVVRSLHIGTPAGAENREIVNRSFDVSEHMTFADERAQKVYQDHPPRGVR